ncbi:hypothetical protein D3C81_1931410 [compost metagenome]
MARADTGEDTTLIQIGFQCRVLNDKGTGVGEADDVLRLVSGGRKAQSGLFAV